MKYRTPLVEAKQRNTRSRDLASELSFIVSEQARIATERKIRADEVQHIEDDLAGTREYEAWKKANGVPDRLTRAEFEVEFSIYA